MKIHRVHCALLSSALAAAILGSCGGGGGDGPTPPPPPVTVAASIAAASSTTLTGTVAQPVSEAPSVIVRDQSGNPMSGAAVVFSVTAGGGTVASSTAVSNASGVATATAWTLGTKVGTNTVTASTGSLAAVTFTATAGPGAAASLAKFAGDEQSAEPGAVVAVAPAVLVKDQFDNPVPGVSVTFTPTGGGTVAGATVTSDAAGIARVSSWTLGSSTGPNTLTATAGSLASVVFAASAGSITLTSITPALLLPSATAVITGSNFSTTATSNSVTIEGVAATVTAATATQLTIAVPASLPCAVTRDATVRVTVGGISASRAHPLQVGKQRSLTVGQSLVIPAADLRCNELAVAGGRYYLSVYNTNRTYSPSGSPFELKGSAAAVAGSAGIAPSARSLSPLRARVGGGPTAVPRDARDERGERLHMKILEANTRFLLENRSRLGARRRGGARFSADPVPPPSVGDLRTIRVPDVNAPGTSLSNICNTYIEITTRVAYVGARSIILEDTTNQLARQMDTTYAAVGAEFDNTMFGILQTNFGNPLVMDAPTDNNGRVVMVFTRKVNDSFPGLAGFVVSCDFFVRDGAITQSNFGEHFYARAATVSGNVSVSNSPPNWAWTMRSTIIHEVKHITSFGERISRGPVAFEASWLEESTARISEELYARSIYGVGQKDNIPYGSASNPSGPYCERRPSTPSCAGYPYSAQKQLQGIASGFYPSPGDHSPLGRRDAGDFSFYNTGWSLVRWAIDNGAASESAFLRGLTQERELRGVQNLEERSGRTFADMLPEWTLAMVVDDYPGFTPSNARLSMPSWNLRSIFAGLNAEFPASFSAFPLGSIARSFGSFAVTASTYPGTTTIFELNGTLVGRQAIELKASGSSLNAPVELGLALVRVQ